MVVNVMATELNLVQNLWNQTFAFVQHVRTYLPLMYSTSNKFVGLHTRRRLSWKHFAQFVSKILYLV